MSETIDDRVKKALEQVRPQLQADGYSVNYCNARLDYRLS